MKKHKRKNKRKHARKSHGKRRFRMSVSRARSIMRKHLKGLHRVLGAMSTSGVKHRRRRRKHGKRRR